MKHYWYAEAIHHLHAAHKSLNAAMSPLPGVKDEELYRKIYEVQQTLLDLTKEAMEKAVKKEEN